MKFKNDEISIYIHWPFCVSKCPYCDFNSYVAKQVDYEKFSNRYLTEINSYKDYINGKKIKSIFFGGGTPSLMPAAMVEKILVSIDNIEPINHAEITCEFNPTSTEVKNLLEFRSAGVNRLSIGIQSFKEENLKFLGRNHSSEEAIKALDAIANVFNNYSFDLIYALPNQTLESWSTELKKAMNFNPNHISLYQLTIEPGTQFASQYKAKKFELPSEDLGDEMYQYTSDYLKSHDYRHYEISNYAKPGFESIHNMNYWEYKPYIGIGPGAHGRINTIDMNATAIKSIKKSDSQCHIKNNKSDSDIYSTFNVKSPTQWIEANNTTLTQCLTKEEILQEICLMNLRLDVGINIMYFNKITELDLINLLVTKGKYRMNKFYLSYFEIIDRKTNYAFSFEEKEIQKYPDKKNLHLRIKRKHIYLTDYLIGKFLDILN